MSSRNLVPRTAQIEFLLDVLTKGHCASVIGLSNMGKTSLLRSLLDADIASRYEDKIGRKAAFIHVDCNRMLDLTDRGLYELILRSAMEAVPDFKLELQAQLEESYEALINAESQFHIPLHFNNALTAMLEDGERDIILLLDEFDEAFAELDGRVFLNLRAKREKYPSTLAYVTANVRHLGTFRQADDTGEFVELTAAHTLALQPLHGDSARQVIEANGADEGIDLSAGQIDFILEESGGHPGLISVVTRTLARSGEASLEALRDALDDDRIVNSECAKLWRQMLLQEQKTALAFFQHNDVSNGALNPLREWGIVTGNPPHFFSKTFERFIRRQSIDTEDIAEGLVLDADAGDVWVDGRQVQPLTDLEFKLLLLLYERRGKVTEKYQLVTEVWGEDYLDEVDDSRIEKLVSRLRGKIEPDPGNPRHLVTVRGRGYRLDTA